MLQSGLEDSVGHQFLQLLSLPDLDHISKVRSPHAWDGQQQGIAQLSGEELETQPGDR